LVQCVWSPLSWHPHKSNSEVYSLLGCSAAYSYWSSPTFQRCVPPPSLGLRVSPARKDSRLYRSPRVIRGSLNMQWWWWW
jgi:hypothetical protein